MHEETGLGDDPRSLRASDRLWDEPAPNQRIRLAKGGAILLEPDGFRVIAPKGLKRSPSRPYESLTHVVATERVLLIGTLTGLQMIRASDFVDPETGPVETRRLLLARLAARPDGDHLRNRMAQLERLSRNPSPSYAIWIVGILCVLGTIAQLQNPLVQQVGSFVPELFGRGELWRGVTSHFLHGAPEFPIHLALNIGGLMVLGHLVERPLGSWRTAILLGLGAFGSILGMVIYDYPEVLGSSGLVAALAGGILALELHFPEAIPAQWRLARRLFIGALIAQLVLDQLLSSYLAGGAHIGGFAGGYAAVWLLGPPSLESHGPSPRLRLATAGVIAILTLGLLGGIPLARHEAGALERHAQRLLSSPPEFHLSAHENAAAWFLATDEASSQEGLGLAIALADRAVATTGRMNPDFLDTLAEALFQAGDRLGALLTIDEAIRLVPQEPYFLEQRRRFTGERDPADRPPPPGAAPEADPPSPRDRPIFDPDAPALVI